MTIVRKIRYVVALLALSGCATSSSNNSMSSGLEPMSTPDMSEPLMAAPSPDPRVGLKAGLQDAGSANWNMRLVSHTPAPQGFVGITNSDLSFSGTNVIQGNYNGFQVWDISNPTQPRLRIGTICPASQSDVSVYRNLLFVSAESNTARLDCGTQAPTAVVSKDRIRGLRIFDITDIDHPKYLANVQTCRGSHTHTVVQDPRDKNNVYVYISGTSGIRPSEELARCNDNPWDPNNSNFRIEVIRIPLAHPEQAEVVSSPTIFADPTNADVAELLYPAAHGASPIDTANIRLRAQFDSARAGLAAVTVTSTAADSARCNTQVDSLARSYGVNLALGGRGNAPGGLLAGGCGAAAVSRGRFGRGPAGPPVTHADSARLNFSATVATLIRPSAASTKADSAAYRQQVDALARKYGVASPFSPRTLTQCHDITVYPAVGLAGGACAGMGLLLDIHDTPNPRRLAAVADSNFSFWHSATFSNDGRMVLFSDEWGGGGAAYCRAGDPRDWGADAIFKIVNGKMVFQSYYKLPAPQTQLENCVAHNGSLIPIPGRTIMVQSWYQGGISVFEWTDPKHPHELAFFDRGPNDSTRAMGGGFWSSYWYNGQIIGSEMQRGLDIFELTRSAAISQNEIDAAKSVHADFLNVQDQPLFVWPATFALSRAYTDQLERWKGLSADQVSAVRAGLTSAEAASGAARRSALSALATQVIGYGKSSTDTQRVQWLANSLKELASATR
ncbi:MAG: hypothetical protein ABI875_03295 [Gemmatimonadales bacterium]